MKVTYLGYACLLVETAGAKLLFDPFVSGNPSRANSQGVELILADIGERVDL